MDLPVGQVFDLFGSSEGAGWLFGARSDRVAVGAPVRISVPVESGPGAAVEILGRFSRIRAQSLIVIEHQQPWLGALRVNFEPLGPSTTRVRVLATVDADGIDWLVRHIGVPLPDPEPSGAVRIGVMTHKTGPGAVYAMNVEYLAELAVDEVNAEGGVGGRPLEILISDDATDPVRAAAEAMRLARAGCRAVFACTTSANFAAVMRSIGDRDILLIQPAINEGGAETATAVRLGERPAAQVAALAEPMMKDTGGRRWFMVGQQLVLRCPSGCPQCTGS